MNVNLTAYLTTMGAGAVLCALWFFLSFRRQAGSGRAACLSGLILLLGTGLGLVCARLAWILMRINYILPKDLLTLRYDELSFFGGVAGVVLGVFLAAKIAGHPAGRVLNAFAPMGALLAAVARFAEGFLGLYGVGFVGEWYESGLFFPVTVEFAWDEYYSEFYLAVYLFSACFCLIAMIFSLVHSGEKRRALRTLFYLCLPQILLESLRMQSINWLFVRAEQLLCFLFCEGVLVFYAFRGGWKVFRSWVPALMGLVTCAVVVVAEFALDGKITLGGNPISHWIIYGVVGLALAFMAIAEHLGHRNLETMKSGNSVSF